MRYNIFCFDDYVLIRNEILRKGEEVIKLPPKELQMLTVLVENAGKLITKDKLVNDIWKGGDVSDESLARCICSLRRRLGEKKDNIFITTLYGKGYIFAKSCTFYEKEDEIIRQEKRKATPLTGVCRINNATCSFNRNSVTHKNPNNLDNLLAAAEKLLKQLFYKKQLMREITCSGIQKKMEKVLHVEPFNALALAIMGIIKTLKNDNTTGYLCLTQAKCLEPDNADIDFYYAWHLTLKGDLTSAEIVLNHLRIYNYNKYDINLLKKTAINERGRAMLKGNKKEYFTHIRHLAVLNH
ncbi:winged helix-turn-helix domain-containing protein [Kalamiella sp. sgz302252]|uniref:winged helix-turn-helix domain-containing protein n=1 Tax=Pantoea sp. sgz302252 TaxID=3341827 RepID=UPI0036D3494F